MTSSSRNSRTLVLALPPRFNFWRTVLSHGWCSLPPFSHDPAAQTLTRTFSLPGGRSALCVLRVAGRAMAVDIQSAGPLDAPAREDLRRQIRICLRIDDDLSPFYREARRHPRFRWIPASGAGRMLRAPTMFEDAVKMICTTNCTWGLTTLMITNLVRTVGRHHGDGHYAFPTPHALADLTESFLRRKIKAGYRSPYLIELARRVAGGTLDIESWRTSTLPTADLFNEMRTVKGIGPYVAGNLLKLAGRYDELALDSWVRAKYCELRRNGRRVSDASIKRDYDPYGSWRGLLFWLEMTREWHQEKFPV